MELGHSSQPRRKTRRVMVGSVAVGDGAPVTVQSMTTTKTADVEGTLQQIYDLAVEYLPRDLTRLRQDRAPHLGVGQRADVGALVDETLTAGIDHEAVEKVVALEDRAERQFVDIGSRTSFRRAWRRSPAPCAIRRRC